MNPSLVILALVCVVLLVMFYLAWWDLIKLRSTVSLMELDLKFLREELVLKNWLINGREIALMLYQSNFNPAVIKTPQFQQKVLMDFELFEQVKSFNPDIAKDEEVIRGREFYLKFLISTNNLPS